MKSSFEFPKEVIEQDSGLFMTLFTNIPLKETVKISCDFLFGNEEK